MAAARRIQVMGHDYSFQDSFILTPYGVFKVIKNKKVNIKGKCFRTKASSKVLTFEA